MSVVANISVSRKWRSSKQVMSCLTKQVVSHETKFDHEEVFTVANNSCHSVIHRALIALLAIRQTVQYPVILDGLFYHNEEQTI